MSEEKISRMEIIRQWWKDISTIPISILGLDIIFKKTEDPGTGGGDKQDDDLEMVDIYKEPRKLRTHHDKIVRGPSEF